jgi:flagella basal body P-ring formation protein FlgA
LGEYARLEGDLALVARASTARILPRKGGVLSPRDVLDALAEAGCGGVPVRLLCPERVLLTPESSLEERIRTVSAWPFRVQAKVPSGHWILAEGTDIEPGLPTVRVLRAETGQRGVARLVWWGLFPVPDRALPAGSRLPEPVPRVTTFRGAGKLALSSDGVKGRVTRVTLNPYEPIPLSALRPEIWLQPGEDVRIRGGRGGLIVEVEGVALESGTSGDWVRVRNRATRAILRGRLVAPGVVEIPLPDREGTPSPAPMPDSSGSETEGGKP